MEEIKTAIKMIRLQRDKIKIHDKTDDAADDYVAASPEECLSFVWELTKEVYSLSGKYQVESKLKSEVIRIVRK